jgi:hypothetical protein
VLFGHGKKIHLFAINKKLTPHLIKTNAHTKNKIKTPNHLITQPNQPSSRHLPPPPPTSGEQTPPPTIFSGDFPTRKKKKDPATGGSRNPPLWPRERDLATPSGPFCLRRT